MIRSSLLALVGFTLASCHSMSRNTQLENVAKDWSFVIRASQVMPVYPMTEDLFPGDVFLVQTPITEQQNTWNEKGYLPLDNHVARLVPDGYEPFYENSFGLKKGDYPPKLWLSPTDASKAWTAAPRAAFPTYSFEAKSGSGLNAALPIHGIPVGLSLLGAKSATGSVTLADARTYGTEIASLVPQVQKWADEHRAFLSDFAPSEKRVNYLRVVNRIYLIGRVAVSIDNSESFDAGAKAGIAPPVELLIPGRSDAPATDASAQPSTSGQPPSSSATGAQPAVATLPAAPATSSTQTTVAPNQATAQYNANVRALNDALNATYASTSPLQIGATFKFTAASARSVSLTETFPRPLIIGYLGFDVAIGEHGDLGPPIPTYAVVSYGAEPRVVSTNRGQLIANSRMQTAAHALKEMAKGGDARAKELVRELDALSARVPPLLPCNFYGGDGKISGHAGDVLRSDPPRYEDVSSFRGGLITTIANLENGKNAPGFKLEDQGSAGAEFIAAHLEMCKAELASLESRLEDDARLLTEVDRYTAPYQSH
jgi:hypothetical protein